MGSKICEEEIKEITRGLKPEVVLKTYLIIFIFFLLFLLFKI